MKRPARLPTSRLLLAALLLLAIPPADSSAAKKHVPPEEKARNHVEVAKAAYEKHAGKATNDLTAAIDAQIVADAHNPETVKRLATQKDALKKSQEIPTEPSLAAAVTRYQTAMQAARSALLLAFDQNINELTKLDKTDDAASLARERAAFAANSTLSAATAPAAQTAPSTPAPKSPKPPAPAEPAGDPAPTDVAGKIKQSREEHNRTLESIRKTLLVSVDSRISQSRDRGDLASLKALETLRGRIQASGPVQGDIADPVVKAANDHALKSTEIADGALTRAYQQAIRDYTRQGKVGLAESAEAELKSLRLSSPQPDASAGGATPLGEFLPLGGRSSLPPLFLANDQVGGTRDGLRFTEVSYNSPGAMRTRDGQFLKHDFVLDLVVTISAGEREAVIVGIGEGPDRTPGGPYYKFVRMSVFAPDRDDGRIELQKTGVGHQTQLGKLRNAGTHLIRVEKRGSAVTFAVVPDFNGKYAPTIEKIIPDIRAYNPALKDGETFLFFGGGGTFKKIRIAVSN